jgi:hypothetical protein
MRSLRSLSSLVRPRLFPAASARRRTSPQVEVCLATYLTSRTLACWRLTEQGAVALGASGPVRAIAFHPEERRIVSAPRSIESAKSLVVREGLALERVRVVNRSREHGLIYAAPVGYLESLLGTGEDTAPAHAGSPRIAAVAPGLLLVDLLLERSGRQVSPGADRPFAVVIDLCAPDDEASGVRLRRERLVIGVVLGDSMTQPAVVCSVTDEPVRDVARLVLYEQKLAEDSPWVLFNSADVLAVVDEVAFYPSEREWYGVPMRRLLQGALAASIAAALGGAGYAVDTAQRLQAAEARTSEARASIERTQREVGALLHSRPSVLARELSLDPAAMLSRAVELWRTGTRISIDSREAATEYTVSVPFTQARLTFQNRPSAHAATDSARVAAVLAIEPPAGCVRSGLRATGALNEVSLIIRCDHPDSTLARVLPR